MCIMWMPANLISQGIIDKNDVIFKKESKNVKLNEENKEAVTETKGANEQIEMK